LSFLDTHGVSTCYLRRSLVNSSAIEGADGDCGARSQVKDLQSQTRFRGLDLDLALPLHLCAFERRATYVHTKLLDDVYID